MELVVALHKKLFVTLLFAALGISASAEQRRGEMVLVRPPVSTPKFVGAWRPAGTVDTVTRVIGAVIDIRQVPVSYVHVQLRNLRDGAIVGDSNTNGNGEYEFDVIEPGTFVVEMVMSDNNVIALSNAGALSRFQTLRTLIQLPGRWDYGSRSMQMLVAPTSFFGIGSASTMTSSTISLAAGQEIRPMDAGEPVSPQQ